MMTKEEVRASKDKLREQQVEEEKQKARAFEETAACSFWGGLALLRHGELDS